MNIKIEHIKIGLDTLVLLAKISFVIGFIFVTSYFFQIDYFPIGSDYSIILYLILTVAFATIFTFIICSGCFIWAPLTWIKLLSMPDVVFLWNKKNPLILDSFQEGKYDFDFNIKARIIIRYIAYNSLYLSTLLIVSVYAKPKGNIISIVASINLILFFIGLVLCENNLKKNSNKCTYSLIEKIITYIKIICITITSGFYLLLTVIFVISFLTKNPSFYEITQHSSYLIFISLMVVFASALCIFTPKDESISHRVWMLMVGSIFTVIFFFMYNFSFISSSLMSILKLGNIKVTSLQIDSVACQAFSKAHYPIKCSPKIKSYFIDNIDVRWRSSEYYVAFKSGKETQELLIPSAHILTVHCGKKEIMRS